ncbi:SAV_915 family protein [Kitasatospora sp. NPDC058965]|uniref:SAV_915 family protein n=1 Tax=Kitasatospora sp. NPDC058965 TaxID=3346682 RepID=UPI0036D0D18E
MAAAAGPRPGTDPLRFVPVRTVAGVQLLRFFRRRDGGRCAVAFSSVRALHELLGPEQEFAELTERALRALSEPVGVRRICLDPRLVAPPVLPAAPPVDPAPPRRPAAVVADG